MQCVSLRLRSAVLCLALTLGVLTGASAAAQDPNPPIAAIKSAMVPMRDGVKLAMDIYLPAGGGAFAAGAAGAVGVARLAGAADVAGKFPAIMMRTPYNKDDRAGAFAAFFVSHGYAVAIQDVRGRYHSEGHWRPLYDDGRDGADTTDWIGRQSWSNGVIGTVGTSYEGGTQHALALANARNVNAMIPLFAMSNVGDYGLRHHGAFELRWLNWVFSMGAPGGNDDAIAAARAAAVPESVPALTDLHHHVREYVLALPLRSGATPLKLAPDYEQWLMGAMSHGGQDPFYQTMGVGVAEHAAEYEDIPVYHVTGWYDSWSLQVANLNFVSLRASKRNPQRLIVGPWTHSAPHLSYAGAAQFTPDAGIDLNEFQLRWFDRWLKHIDNGVDREAPVRIYVMGGGDAHKTPEGRVFVGGHWRDEQEWPLARTVYTSYYLHRGTASSRDRAGSLSTDAPSADSPLSYRFDPHHPVPTLGGNNSSQGDLAKQGAVDQRCRPTFWLCKDSDPLSARKDVLVFKTEPLTQDMEVTGKLVVTLWAASDSLDTDFTAKLVDVYPPNADYPAGIDLNVGDGIVRARYRHASKQPQFLRPRQPYEFTIELYPTSLVFERGHRIRLDISSSNFPRFDVNPNTGEPLNANRRWHVAKNSIYLDVKHPSRIVLPVIPAPGGEY